MFKEGDKVFITMPLNVAEYTIEVAEVEHVLEKPEYLPTAYFLKTEDRTLVLQEERVFNTEEEAARSVQETLKGEVENARVALVAAQDRLRYFIKWRIDCAAKSFRPTA